MQQAALLPAEQAIWLVQFFEKIFGSWSGPGTGSAWFSGSAWFTASSCSLQVFNFLARKSLYMVNLT